MFFNQSIETIARVDLRKLQNERFLKLINRMSEKQKFYKSRWSDSNVDLKSVKSIDDIDKLPFTTKEDLRDNYPFGLQAISDDQIRRIHCSSGSTGNPTVVSYSQNDLDVFAEVVARSLVCGGAKRGMKIHNAYGYGLFTGGLGIQLGADLLGLNVIPVSGGMTQRQVKLLLDLQPEIICCTPSYLLTLIDAIESKGIQSDQLNLKFAILGAEPWTEAIRQEVERKLNLKATNIYGLSEIIGPGVSQEDYSEQNGSHIWEDHFYPEIVDPITKEVLPYGEEGVLVLTTLSKDAMPLMRYWTNDICSLFLDKSSKRTHVKMTRIKGRADDMLVIRGVNVFPTQLEVIIKNFDEISPNYQIVIDKEKRLDSLTFRVEWNEAFYKENKNYLPTGIVNHISSTIKSLYGINAKVVIEEPGVIPKSQGGKLNRVMDNRNMQ